MAIDRDPRRDGGPAPDSVLPEGRSLGPYAVEARLGSGGAGVVYRARDTRTGQVVALKVLRPEVFADPVLRARFLREGRVRVEHPAVVRLHEVAEAGGHLYLAMDLVEGETLAEVFGREGPLAPARAVRLLDPIVAALAAAHEAGVVHRDLKPSNVMVGEGDAVKVLDFGIARFVGASAANEVTLTERGEFVGTLGYAAPEQVEGDAVDARTDLYQVGVVAFEALAGRRPFAAPTTNLLALEIVRKPAPRLLTFRPDLGERGAALDAFFARALAKAPGDRFQSAGELRAALHEALGAPRPAREAALAGGRVLLGLRGAPDLRKLFVVPGATLAFGRDPADRRRGLASDVLLRVLPCRGALHDPENFRRTTRVSRVHGRIDVAGARATVVDLSSRGTALDGRRLPKGRPTPLPDRFDLDLGNVVALSGRLVTGPEGGVDAVVLRRTANVPEHAYVLLVRAVALGGDAPDALGAGLPACRLRRRPGDGGGGGGGPGSGLGVELEVAGRGSRVLEVGARIDLGGGASLEVAAASDRDFVTP